MATDPSKSKSGSKKPIEKSLRKSSAARKAAKLDQRSSQPPNSREPTPGKVKDPLPGGDPFDL
jgi:hypothetical protein